VETGTGTERATDFALMAAQWAYTASHLHREGRPGPAHHLTRLLAGLVGIWMQKRYGVAAQPPDDASSASALTSPQEMP